jgi:hypothetical protein
MRSGDAMEATHTLVCSTTRGRYALDQADGPDVNAGMRQAVLLGDLFVVGTVEHSRVYSGGSVSNEGTTSSLTLVSVVACALVCMCRSGRK